MSLMRSKKTAEIGVQTVGFTGKDGGKLAKLADVALIAPAVETERIQEVHRLCAAIEGEDGP
jgi:D-sedoheptulose 7-phosphate isomerase